MKVCLFFKLTDIQYALEIIKFERQFSHLENQLIPDLLFLDIISF